MTSGLLRRSAARKDGAPLVLLAMTERAPRVPLAMTARSPRRSSRVDAAPSPSLRAQRSNPFSGRLWAALNSGLLRRCAPRNDGARAGLPRGGAGAGEGHDAAAMFP